MDLTDFEGTVVPHYMRQMGQVDALLRSLPMRFGRVVRVHAPNEQTSLSKLFNEYDVLVEAGSEHEPATRFTIPHCLVMSSFGGVADFSRWTPRVIQGDKDKPDFGLSSNVCVILANGSSFGGIIVGGPQVAGGESRNQGEPDDPSDGHHVTEQFNGLRWEVDKDGQLSILRRGATDPYDNKLDSSDPEGSKLQLLKGGDVVADSRHDLRALADNTALVQSAQGATLQSVQGQVDIKAATTVQTTSAFVKLGAATDQMVKGTTYRAAEASCNTTVAAALTSLATLLSALAAQPANAATIQIASPSGPAPATPLLVAAAAAATAAAGAIAGFEAGSPAYLSTKNSLD